MANQNISAQIGILTEVIKAINENKQSIINAASSLKEIITTIAAFADGINKNQANTVRRAVGVTTDIISSIESLISTINKNGTPDIKPLQASIDNIITATGSFDKLELRKLILLNRKFDVLSETVPLLVDVVDGLTNISRKKTNINLIPFGKLLDDFITVISSLDKLKLRKLTLLNKKLDILSETVPLLVDVVDKLSNIKTTPNQKINQLQIVFEALHDVISVIADIKTKGLKKKISTIHLIANDLEKVIKIIGNINVPRRTEKSLKAAAGMIKGFRDVIIALLVLTPLAALFVIASPLIVLVVWLAGLVIRLITFIIMKAVGVKTFIAITLLIAMLGMLIILSLEILALALLAPKILKGFPALIKVLIGIVVIAAILALFGWIVSMAMPLMLAGLIGVGIVTLAVFAILAVAAMLWLIGEIQLDVDKIMSNVAIIFDVANQVIMAALAPIDNPMEPIKDRGLTDILTSIGLKNLGLIMASIQLALTVVAVFCILLIAVMLRLLQMLNLDTARILNNVAMIFDVCQMIIDRVFQPDDVDVQMSTKQGLEPLTTSLPAAFRRIIGAIFAVAYLAVMFIAVACVLLISVMLRLLQNLNLDEVAILNNVEAVMNICQTIIDSIFRPDDKDNNSSTRNLGLIGWAFPQLAPVLESILAMAYLAVMVLAVAALWGIAGMLTQIEKLQLDKEKILNNVDTIIDCVTSIINSIFLPDSANKDSSERTLLKSFLLWVLPIGGVISAILSMAYLAVMVISVLCLVGIAKMLGVLEKTKIDEKKIKENVRKIISTCRYLTDNIFKPDDENSDKSDRTSLKGFLEWAFSGVSGIVSIIQGIFSIAYLAVMIISVAIMVGIAKLLQQLAEIDPAIFTTAKENVKAIIGVIDEIKNICFRPDEKTEESEHGVLMGIVKYFFGNGVADLLKGITTIGYVALMYFAVALMLGLSKMMVELANIDITNIGKASSNADTIMKTAHDLINKLIQPVEKSKTEGDSLLIDALRFVWGDWIADLTKLVTALVELFPQLGIMYIIVGALVKLSDMLVKINSLKLDELFEDTVITNADRIMTITAEILDLWKISFKNIDTSDIDDYAEIVDAMVKMMSAFTPLAAQFVNLSNFQWKIFENAKNRAIISIRNIKDIFSELIPELKNSENSVRYEAKHALDDYASAIRTSLTPLINEMTSMMNSLNNLATQISKVSNANINTIQNGARLGIEAFNVVKQIIFKILGNADINSALTQLPIYRNAILETTRVLLQGKNMINAVGSLVSQINSTSEIGFDTLMNSSKFYQRALNEFNDILTNADKIQVDDSRVRSTMDLLDRISQTVHNFVKVEDKDVKNSKNITDNYIKFLQQVDKMDYQKLNTTAWIMRSWASISRDLRGDFEGLSRTVNQHIMPMLNALNKTMDETTKCQKQIIDELTKPVTFGDTSGIQSYSDTPGSGTDITGGSGSTDSGLSVSTTTTQTQQPNTQTHSNRPHASQPKIDTDIKPGKYVVDLTKITPYN